MSRRRGDGVYDAVVVGSGPNGLAAAVELARNGHSVAVLEAEDAIGGGTRSADLTLPGYVHDVCSAIHPFGYASPLFSSLPLEEHGLEWVHPPAPLAPPRAGTKGAPGARPETKRPHGGRPPPRRSTPPRLRPRRLLGHTPFRIRLPLIPLPAARGAWPGVGSSTRPARPPLRRRLG